MVSSPSRDERDAYLLADIASAHEAGLSAEAILGGPSSAALRAAGRAPTGGGSVESAESLTEGLHRRGLDVAPHELLMLRTAERSGTLGRALRNLAEQRGKRAARHRELRRRLAYPAFLLVFGFGVSLLASGAAGSSAWIPILIVGLLVGGGYFTVWYVLRSLKQGSPRQVPLVSSIVTDVGELPYLQSLHGLYSAGVHLKEAHELALRTSPIDGVRMRLFAAGRALEQGSNLAESLDAAAALHPETRLMLSAAEQSGDIEGALQRAIDRRQQSLDLATRLLVRIVVAVLVVLVYGYVGYVIVSFYADLYGNLPLQP